MATYLNDLRLTELATGEGSGTWGTTTNTSLELIGEALGYATQQVFGSDADATTTIADGASDPARAMYFKITSAGSLTATRTCTIAPNTISRVMFIENATTGSQSIAISQGSGASVTILAGKTAVVYLDGAGAGAAVVDAMAGVDPGVTDTLAEVLAAGNTSGANNLIIDNGQAITTNTINETTAASGVTIDSVLLKDDGVNATNLEITNLKANDGTSAGSIADSTGVVTLASSVLTTADINGGTIDGTTLGATTPASVAATTLSTTGAATFSHGNFVWRSSNAYTERMRIDSSGGLITNPAAGGHTIFNEAGVDADFRVESDTNTHALFVQGSDGNVGIGTSSPSYALHVATNTGFIAEFQNTAGANHRPVKWTDNTGASVGSLGADFTADEFILQAISKPLVFGTGTDGTERMRIDASGNVGIGAAPTGVSAFGANKFLELSGATVPALLFRPTGSTCEQTILGANDGLVISATGAASNVNNKIRFFTTDVNSSTTPLERMRLDASGSVGIGTNSPSSYDFNDPAKLVVANTSGNSTLTIASGASNIGYLAFADGTTGTSRYSGSVQYNHSTNALSMHTTDGTARLTIASTGAATFSGNVNVTGSSPTLTIASSDNLSIIAFTNSGGATKAGSILTDNGGTMYFRDTAFTFQNYDGTVEYARIDASGDLTITGTLNGISTTKSASGNRWGILPEVESNGVMEIGRYIDFHSTDGDTSDYGARLDYDGTNIVSTNAFSMASGIYLGGTVAANLLDDYEEGTWTPSVGGDATYTTQVGTYTKVGRQVVAHFSLVINTIGTGSTYEIAGLPFTSAYSGQVYVGYFGSLATAATSVAGYIAATYSSINLVYTTAATTTVVNAGNAIGSSTNIQGVAVYFT
jgi:hypothetical protein